MTNLQHQLDILPSAYTPDLEITNDWTYESCRIASLLYAALIEQKALYSALKGSSTSRASSPVQADAQWPLVQALYRTVLRTDTDNNWSELAGVFYWVCTIGAIAARDVVAANTDKQMHGLERIKWAKRCLAMFSVRTITILVFQNPIAVVYAQKTLLAVQHPVKRSS
jgi:hypothetical protein